MINCSRRLRIKTTVWPGGLLSYSNFSLFVQLVWKRPGLPRFASDLENSILRNRWVTASVPIDFWFTYQRLVTSIYWEDVTKCLTYNLPFFESPSHPPHLPLFLITSSLKNNKMGWKKNHIVFCFLFFFQSITIVGFPAQRCWSTLSYQVTTSVWRWCEWHGMYGDSYDAVTLYETICQFLLRHLPCRLSTRKWSGDRSWRCWCSYYGTAPVGRCKGSREDSGSRVRKVGEWLTHTVYQTLDFQFIKNKANKQQTNKNVFVRTVNLIMVCTKERSKTVLN